MNKIYVALVFIVLNITIAKANFVKTFGKPLPITIENNKIITCNFLNNLKNIENSKLTKITKDAKNKVSGIISWYSDKFHGKKTSSGELYDKEKLTAAHKSLPFGTKVKVTNIANGKSVIVKINDRGPHTKSRLLDLSRAAFSSIGSVDSGVLKVDMEIID